MTAQLATLAAGDHATIHRVVAGPNGPRSACAHTSHGVQLPLVDVVAEVEDPAAWAVIKLLRQREIKPCRMCRRCWRRHQVPMHNGCFRKKDREAALVADTTPLTRANAG